MNLTPFVPFVFLLAVAVVGAGASPPAPVTADADAARFAEAFAAADGRPSAASLQAAYFDPGSTALRAFDALAIGGAQPLAAHVAADPAVYRAAVATCLTPAARGQAERDAQAMLAAYRGLFPDFPTPSVHLLFGAGNSAGMRLPGSTLAIALERVCAVPDWRPGFAALLAHELAHVPQPELAEDDPARRDLLVWALREGAADYLGRLVRGEDPSGADNAWAMAREQALFAAFHQDRQRMHTHWQGEEPGPEAIEAGTRWLWNAPAPDRPADLAYWIGQRIWHGYLARAPDRAEGLRQLLTLDDPDAILAASGYAPR